MLNNEQILLILAIFFLLTSLVFYLRYIKVFKQNKELSNESLALAKDNEYLSENVRNLNQELELTKSDLNSKSQENQSLSNELSRLNEELKNTKELLNSIQNDNKTNLAKLETTTNELNSNISQNEALKEKVENYKIINNQQEQKLNTIQDNLNSTVEKNTELNNELSRLNEELKNTKELLNSIQNDNKTNLAKLETTTNELNSNISQNEALSEKIKLYENSLKSLEIKYENMLKTLEENLKEQNEKSSKLIYEENTKLLLTNSNELLAKIFSPLKEQISEYEKTLLKQNTSIENNIKTMFETSQNLGKKADEFANLLKGDKKARGDFGEIMLKQCLLASGLRENEHFYMQESFKDEENRVKRPDAIVYFEPKKCVIIDSKFSLPSSDDLELCKSEIANNLFSRINELAKKEYENVVEYANEYVLLFVPYQNILDLALEYDSEIFKKAEAKKIFIVSPTTLFMGLKMIYFGWQNYEINQNALNIFNEFGKFYDKFTSFYEDYEKLKKQSESSFAKIDTHLYGKGSVANRLENLRNLGIKNKKLLPNKAIESNF